ncbi:MAG: hypothetical protein KC635_19050, partial [Myxococcales bacterium]|nr:hypothetical protein [Myxococcales bacterium]
ATGAFRDPSVVAVFAPTLYAPSSLSARLAGLVTCGDTLTRARSDERARHLQHMERGLVILRRAAVDRLGALRTVLAGAVDEGERLAHALSAAGGTIRTSSPLVRPEPSAATGGWARLWSRRLSAVRAERPLQFIAGLLVDPIVLPLLLACVHPAVALPALALAFLSAAWRVALAAATDRVVLRRYGLRVGWWALLRPVADLMRFGIGVRTLVADLAASVRGRAVRELAFARDRRAG